MTARRFGCGLGLSCMLLWASGVCAQAEAEPKGDSEALIRHGVELRKTGQNAEALLEFERAFALHPSLRCDFNYCICYCLK